MWFTEPVGAQGRTEETRRGKVAQRGRQSSQVCEVRVEWCGGFGSVGAEATGFPRFNVREPEVAYATALFTGELAGCDGGENCLTTHALQLPNLIEREPPRQGGRSRLREIRVRCVECPLGFVRRADAGGCLLLLSSICVFNHSRFLIPRVAGAELFAMPVAVQTFSISFALLPSPHRR